jgi:hypothetical protein
MVNEGDYPNKVTQLREEVRQAKDKIRALDEKCRRDEKNSI